MMSTIYSDREYPDEALVLIKGAVSVTLMFFLVITSRVVLTYLITC